MKKISLILVLGLVIFATSCSQSTEEAFLDKVAGKQLLLGESIISFSDDSKNFTMNNYTFEFTGADSSDRGNYSGSVYNFIIVIDGNSALITMSDILGNSVDEPYETTFL